MGHHQFAKKSRSEQQKSAKSRQSRLSGNADFFIWASAAVSRNYFSAREVKNTSKNALKEKSLQYDSIIANHNCKTMHSCKQRFAIITRFRQRQLLNACHLSSLSWWQLVVMGYPDMLLLVASLQYRAIFVFKTVITVGPVSNNSDRPNQYPLSSQPL